MPTLTQNQQGCASHWTIGQQFLLYLVTWGLWATTKECLQQAASPTTLSFLSLFFWNSLFFPLRGIPCFFGRFSLLFQGFQGFGRDKNPCLFGGFPSFFPKKQGKEGQGSLPCCLGAPCFSSVPSLSGVWSAPGVVCPALHHLLLLLHPHAHKPLYHKTRGRSTSRGRCHFCQGGWQWLPHREQCRLVCLRPALNFLFLEQSCIQTFAIVVF